MTTQSISIVLDSEYLLLDGQMEARSRYLLSVMVNVVKNGEIIPAKMFYVRNQNKRKEYLCLISTDINLDENEIIRIYGEHRESNDNCSLGEIFLYFSDKMSDITWIQAFQMLLQVFRTILMENTELSNEKISELIDSFMNTLPMMLKTQMQAA